MAYKVQLLYFRQTGKFLTSAYTTSARAEIAEIWAEIDDLRRLGRLPRLRLGAGRDLFVLVDVPDHPQRAPHLVMAPFLDEDDVTPPGTPTGQMLPLTEIQRTSTRDVVKPSEDDSEADTNVASDDEVTPVDHPIPKPPDA